MHHLLRYVVASVDFIGIIASLYDQISEPLCCQYCSAVYSRQDKLNNHLEKSHGVETVKRKKNFYCPFCGIAPLDLVHHCEDVHNEALGQESSHQTVLPQAVDGAPPSPHTQLQLSQTGGRAPTFGQYIYTSSAWSTQLHRHELSCQLSLIPYVPMSSLSDNIQLQLYIKK